MKRIVLFLIAVSLRAATYYVASNVSSPAGSDSNAGTQAAPWLTIQHAVNSMACGDTLIVVADGNFVAGDANLPYFANCGTTTTIQSSALAQLAPAGYRTNPANDSAAYGKLSFAFQGIVAQPSVYNWNAYFGYSGVSINTSTGQLRVVPGNGLAQAGLANGSQVEFEPQSEASSFGSPVFPTINPPGPLSHLTHYYVVGCSSSPVCGAVNSTFFLAASPGGSPLPITSCGLYCENTMAADPTSGGACTYGQMQYNPTTSTIWQCNGTWNAAGSSYLVLGITLGVNTQTNTFTMPQNWGGGAIVNGLPVAFSAGGLQVIGTLPDPLQVDAIYYTVNVSGSSFQIAPVAGGTPITITSTGTGMLSVANTNVARNWAFRGLEAKPNGSHLPFTFFNFGNPAMTSQYGMPSNFEIDRCYLHDNPGVNGIARAVFDNGRFISIHDSWLTNGYTNEGQAISGTVSVGPTTITNNLLAAAGEVSLYGGDWPAYPAANANKLFQGNYFYKPPVWKTSSGSGAASGACLYDATDPANSGGEWYLNTSGGQVYQCNSSGVWATTGAAFPPQKTFKDMAEHKNGRYFTYNGNLFNGSYVQAQSGEVWNNSMEYGSGPGMANDHITITNNAAFNVMQFSTRTSQCGLTPSAICQINPGDHVTVNNLVVVNPLAGGPLFNPALCGNCNGIQSNTGGTAPYFNGDYWNHNTIWLQDRFPYNNATPMSANSPNGACPPYTPVPNNLFTYTNNIAPGDFIFQCVGPSTGIATFYTNGTFQNNALTGATGNYSNVGSSNSWTHTVTPANIAAVGFVNGTGTMSGDYHLASTSNHSASNPFFTQLATDATDLGADIDMINMATSGAAAGTPPWNQQAGLRIDPGSSQAVFHYTAPTTDACTATIYSAAARIAGNQVVATADTSANSISNANDREIYVSGLQSSTAYWYKLACGGGVLMVGKFSTRAPGRQALLFNFDWSNPTPMQYSPSPSMADAVSLPPATRQFIPVAANSLVYVQKGPAGPITMLIAP
jgi:hypothetical protein